MKKYRAILYAVGLLLLLAGIYFAIIYQKKPGGTEVSGKTSIFQTSPENITALSLAKGGEAFELSMQDGIFVVRDKPSIVLDKTKVDKLVTELSDITVEEVVKEAKSAADYKEYGLDESAGGVAVTLADGTTRVFMIGGKTPVGASYYFKENPGNTIYTITAVKAELLLTSLKNLRSKNLYSIEPEKLTQIKITRGSGNDLNLERTYENGQFGKWYLLPQGKLCNDDFVKEQIINKMVSVYISDFVEDNPKDLEKYSLAKPKYVVEFKESDSGVEKILVGGSITDGYYVKNEGVPSVYLVSTDAMAFLDIEMDAVTDKQVYSQSLNNVAAIEVADKLNINTLRISNNVDRGFSFAINNSVVIPEKFNAIYDKIMGISIRGNLPEGYTADGQPEAHLRVTLISGGEDYIKFIPYDAKDYAVVINDEAEYFVLKSDVNTILKNVMDLAENPT